MKPSTKLKIRKRALMALRSLLWHADEWLHREELKLREELDAAHSTGRGSENLSDLACDYPSPAAVAPILRAGSVPGRDAARSRAHKVHRRKRSVTALEFDRRFLQ